LKQNLYKASLGVALCLPTSIIYDMIFKSGNVLNGISFIGCVFVFGAFVSIIRAGDNDEDSTITSEVNNSIIENINDKRISNGAFDNSDANISAAI
jgi:hypothetical protein